MGPGYRFLTQMKLEDISVEVRPRNPWEAIDVGFQLPRVWFREVYIPWLLFIIPLIVIVTILFQSIPWLAALVIWWLKPLYDRLLLSIYSQRLFGDQPGAGDVLRSIPSLFKTGLFINLTLLRFNPSRSFHLPVWQLEGLRGKKRQKRIRILSARIYSYPLWLTIVCIHIEMLIYFTIIGIIYLLIPEQLNINYISLFTYEEKPTLWLLLLSNMVLFAGIVIIEPFYVAAGFMLYINRRIRLEGWDIEIAFRKLGNRLQKLMSRLTILTLALILPMLTTPSGSLLAATISDKPVVAVNEIVVDANESQRVITEVLERKELNGIKKITSWKFTGNLDEPKDFDSGFFDNMEKLAQFLATIFKALIWLLVILAIIFIFLYREKWLWLFTGKKKSISEYEAPEQLFGMEITPESLPSDIASAARNEFQKGNIRSALSLLYRGSLMVLVSQHQVKLHNSQTEVEVVTTAEKSLAAHQIDYLQQLTDEWIQTAYANRLSTANTFDQLCNDWATLQEPV